jgi:fluoride exporter
MTAKKIFLVLIGGSLGSISRYGISLLSAGLFGGQFPWGTFIVNMGGCFFIGIAFGFADRGSRVMNPSMRLFFITGFLGGLTTFSTYALEVFLLSRTGTSLVAFSYFFVTNILGVVLVILGMRAAQIKAEGKRRHAPI